MKKNWMTARDFDYIERRLSDPCLPALEAYAKLRFNERASEDIEPIANKLMFLIREFTDGCAVLRHEAIDVGRKL